MNALYVPVRWRGEGGVGYIAVTETTLLNVKTISMQSSDTLCEFKINSLSNPTTIHTCYKI
jgi:hypothetical protein